MFVRISAIGLVLCHYNVKLWLSVEPFSRNSGRQGGKFRTNVRIRYLPVFSVASY